MASNAPNAILAIDSLDRYILAGGIETRGVLAVNWTLAAPTTLTALAGVPVVGAVLTLGGSPAPGWPVLPPDEFVTIIGVVGNQITINASVTANSGPVEYIFQTFTFDAGSSPAQPRSKVLVANFNRDVPNSNDFIISSPGALIYGYINKIIVTQIQLQYNIPTVCIGRNDFFHLQFISPIGVFGFGQFIIPYGFYTPTEMASILQTLIVNTPAFNAVGLTVSYALQFGFIFTSSNNFGLFVPEPGVLRTVGFSQEQVDSILKTYKMLGLTAENGIKNPVSSTPTFIVSSHYPDFLYTPYIDFYSDVLTNYQNVKDTNTSIAKPKGLLARLYLSGTGNIQVQTVSQLAPTPLIPSEALGSSPFVMTADLNNPKVIQWTRDVAVPSIDFQLRDCYGDLIPGIKEKFPTEFQMTLLCVEEPR